MIAKGRWKFMIKFVFPLIYLQSPGRLTWCSWVEAVLSNVAMQLTRDTRAALAPVSCLQYKK